MDEKQIEFKDFEAVEMRIGTIVRAEAFAEARKPAIKLWIDLGRLGEKKSSAQLTRNYDPQMLIGRQIVAVVNMGSRQIGPFLSEVLVLGALDPKQGVVLLAPDKKLENGSRIA